MSKLDDNVYITCNNVAWGINENPYINQSTSLKVFWDQCNWKDGDTFNKIWNKAVYKVTKNRLMDP